MIHAAALFRGANYTATAVGIAVAISCNYVLLNMLGFTEGELSMRSLLIAPVEVLLATLLMIIVISPFLELASLYPGSPGIRTYTKKSLGETSSMLVTFSYLGILLLIAGIESSLLLNILTSFMPGPIALLLLAITLLSVIIINLFGIQSSERFQRGATALLWFGSLALCWLAYLYSPTQSISSILAVPTESNTDFSTTAWLQQLSLHNIALGIFLFIGIELAATTVRQPADLHRVLPRATLVAVLLIAVLYTSMAFVLPVIVQPAYTGDNALLWFAATLSAPHWTFIALFLLILALLTSFNAGLRGASRMVYMLGREGRISQRMTRLGADGLTPVNAVTAVGLLALLSGVATIALDLTRMLSELSAALICAVYAALLIASSRNAQRKQFVTDFFNSSVPLTARWLLASLFAVLSGVSAIQLMRDTTGFVLVAMMIVGLILLTQLTAARGQLHPVMNNQSN